jgi:alpha-galactosidase
LWAIQAAPLILGNDVRTLTPEVRDILVNDEVIAIDQDALGKQGRRVVKEGEHEIWVKPLADGSSAVALFNRGMKSANISVDWPSVGLNPIQRARDVWRHVDLSKHENGYEIFVPAHGSVLLRVQ